MEERPGQFDDAALKAAVRHTWGQQQAPENLRRNITAIALAARPAPVWFRIAPRPLAAAAALVIGISSVAFQLYRLRPTTPQLPNHYQLSAALVSELASRHDADTELSNPGTDLAKLGQQLSQKLGIKVLSASPGADYHFEGASISTIGNQPVAHLLFKRGRGSESLSIFSMPASELPHTNRGSHYDGSDGKHMIAGYVQDGSFYCLAASGPNSVRCSGMISGAMQELSSQFPSTQCSTQPAQ
jgi:hypothetical protein